MQLLLRVPANKGNLRARTQDLMTMQFQEAKAAQLAAYFLQKSDGELFLLKLVKLLYIADREAFRELGRPITYDCYVSMSHGPVVSQALDLMNGSVRGTGEWNAMISPREGHKLSIADESEVSFDNLSEAEKAIADRVYEDYGHVPRFELARMTHEFAEWRNPNGSILPISYQDILRALGYGDEQVDDLMGIIEEQEAADNFASSRAGKGQE